jgi:hypothetical protein
VGIVRFRRSGAGGGLKLRRKLAVDWRIEGDVEEASAPGGEGIVALAVAFGDPRAVGAGALELGGVGLQPWGRVDEVDLRASTRLGGDVVDGPFFGPRNALGLGAWVPNLPSGESLHVDLSGLTPDEVYQVRFVFHDAKGRGTGAPTVSPGEFRAELVPGRVSVVVGTFVAPTDRATLTIGSADGRPPFVNAMVLRRVGSQPRARIQWAGGLGGPSEDAGEERATFSVERVDEL